MILVENVLNDIVGALNLQVDIYTIITEDDNKYKCYALKTHWINTGTRLTIDGNEYKVTAFEIDKYFTVQEIAKQALNELEAEYKILFNIK